MLVHNQTGVAQTAAVRLQAEGLVTEGPDTHTLALRPGQIGEASWQVTAAGIAPATIRVTARTTGGGQQTHYTDGVELPLAVRPHGREQLDGATGELLGGRPSAAALRLDPGAILSVSELSIRVTPSVSTALVGAVEYLVGYPYGCTEQTMSRFYPDVLVQRVRALGVARNETLEDLPRMIRDSLARLYRFQHDSGAWGWWEHDDDSPWMTAYALIGLSTAAEEGYPVNGEVVKRARDAAEKLVAAANEDDRVFLAYAMALIGDTDAARAEQHQRLDLGRLGPQGLAYAALLDKRLGGTGRPALAALMAQARPGRRDAVLGCGARGGVLELGRANDDRVRPPRDPGGRPERSAGQRGGAVAHAPPHRRVLGEHARHRVGPRRAGRLSREPPGERRPERRRPH